ncbi:MAG: DUF523 and DUF1722 domain-containing protein [candidate division KSB1 bacterium]|nr:DUF523 and DUF1722 domain-containing protein [candidate division KSB1 bacterium]MDZ7304018.1 DUF523 and DUF1722 domain-containing protein [candidate division KSB1 bacterium]MDZ7313272.1 DUF523 and DUF1722 domain-containing protein [candidate division KSB1 bacterium]
MADQPLHKTNKQPEAIKLRLGVSTCLLGENVRFDGGHKKDSYLSGVLAKFVEWVPVCPEVEIGLGTPRESLHLAGDAETPRLVTTKTNRDYTEAMLRFAHAKIEQLKQLNLNGYILKKDSPSCGMERVRVYSAKGMAVRTGVGLYARVLMEKMPTLPIEEEGRLNDPRLRENFIVRVFANYRWQRLLEKPFRLRDLVAFHTQHKFLLLAHHERNFRELGKLVATAKSYKPKELVERYAQLFFETLRHPATNRKHANVLQHISGYFKKQLEERDKKELQATVDDYRRGLLPLIVPITLIKHYLNKFDIQYIQDQVYVNPHPKELMLLNHV